MDTDGFRPLHVAAQQGAVEIAGLLLDAGASVDPTNGRKHAAIRRRLQLSR